jgi:hypothetical protein
VRLLANGTRGSGGLRRSGVLGNSFQARHRTPVAAEIGLSEDVDSKVSTKSPLLRAGRCIRVTCPEHSLHRLAPDHRAVAHPGSYLHQGGLASRDRPGRRPALPASRGGRARLRWRCCADGEVSVVEFDELEELVAFAGISLIAGVVFSPP